jgi:hypothetical protein
VWVRLPIADHRENHLPIGRPGDPEAEQIDRLKRFPALGDNRPRRDEQVQNQYDE